MTDLRGIKIAVDFDGTIVEHAYPGIGREKLFAFDALKKLDAEGALLMLWTIRTGSELDAAVEFCRSNGVVFYTVNKNYPEETYDGSTSRKIDADIYIDDRNIGGFHGWGEVLQEIMQYDEHEREAQRTLSKRSFLKMIMRRQNPEQ